MNANESAGLIVLVLALLLGILIGWVLGVLL